MALLQDGIPLDKRPFLHLAKQTGLDESEVIEHVQAWLEQGVFKRWGAVVNHRALGMVSNAMVVWDIPDDKVDDVAQSLAQEPRITLCYRRRRQPPQWPYNLFTMIHGRSEEDIQTVLQNIRCQHSVNYPHEVLISRRCFRQRGARYVSSEEVNHGTE